jgi:hypothetical protein
LCYVLYIITTHYVYYLYTIYCIYAVLYIISTNLCVDGVSYKMLQKLEACSSNLYDNTLPNAVSPYAVENSLSIWGKNVDKFRYTRTNTRSYAVNIRENW